MPSVFDGMARALSGAFGDMVTIRPRIGQPCEVRAVIRSEAIEELRAASYGGRIIAISSDPVANQRMREAGARVPGLELPFRAGDRERRDGRGSLPGRFWRRAGAA